MKQNDARRCGVGRGKKGTLLRGWKRGSRGALLAACCVSVYFTPVTSPRFHHPSTFHPGAGSGAKSRSQIGRAAPRRPFRKSPLLHLKNTPQRKKNSGRHHAEGGLFLLCNFSAVLMAQTRGYPATIPSSAASAGSTVSRGPGSLVDDADHGGPGPAFGAPVQVNRGCPLRRRAPLPRLRTRRPPMRSTAQCSSETARTAMVAAAAAQRTIVVVVAMTTSSLSLSPLSTSGARRRRRRRRRRWRRCR